MRSNVSCGINRNFSRLFPTKGQIAHALLTRPPLGNARTLAEASIPAYPVRLACVRHAASVHPEPGSNSLIKFILNPNINCLAFINFFKQIEYLLSTFTTYAVRCDSPQESMLAHQSYVTHLASLIKISRSFWSISLSLLFSCHGSNLTTHITPCSSDCQNIISNNAYAVNIFFLNLYKK